MSFVDYNKLFNGKFLDTIQIPEDASKWHIRTPMEKEIHKNINNILNKNKYTELNEKEIDILKKFSNSIDLYELNSRKNIIDKSENTIKEIINNIINLPIEELLVLLNEFQIIGFFNITTDYFNKEFYLCCSQGGNNIANEKYLSDKLFLKIYKNIIKESLELYFSDIISDKIIDKIIQYEIEISKNKLLPVKKRDIIEIMNIYDINEIKFNNYNFKKVINIIFEKANIQFSIKKIIFDEKKPFNFYLLLDKFLIEPEFRYYLSWCFLSTISNFTFNKLCSNKFKLNQIIKGIEKQIDYKKKKILISNELIGHLISKEYLTIIDPKIKPNIKIMIEYIKKTFRNRLIKNKWMDSETKYAAIQKLENMQYIIGPEKSYNLLNYNNMSSLFNDNFIKNYQIIKSYCFYNSIQNLVKNERLFYGTIYNINAFYSPADNLMIFPYGILYEPFFYPVDLNNLENIETIAYNFGAIGSAIGHEMIHGFDDQGSKYDKDGILNKNSSWWNKESANKYKILTDKLIDEYKKHNINTKLTLGENIADVGGLLITYNSLLNLINENKNQLKNMSYDAIIKKVNYNFINAFNIIWRVKLKPQERELHLLNNVHSPADLRINVPLNIIFEKIDDKTIIEKKNIEEHIW
jgi:predicted metalloendopeptidase